jgi:hypothetical protein
MRPCDGGTTHGQTRPTWPMPAGTVVHAPRTQPAGWRGQRHPAIGWKVVRFSNKAPLATCGGAGQGEPARASLDKHIIEVAYFFLLGTVVVVDSEWSMAVAGDWLGSLQLGWRCGGVRYRPIRKICVRRAAHTKRGGDASVSMNLRWEEAPPGRRCGHLVIGEEEEVAGAGRDEGDW